MALPIAPAQLRAALYLRVSTVGQEQDGSSLDTQEAAGRRHADSLDATIDEVHVYREVYSGVQLWERPALTRLRDAISRRVIDIVIVYAIDRLARDPVHLGLIMAEAAHAGVRVEFVSEPLDTTPEGELIRFVRGYAAKVEHTKIIERTQRGKRDKAARGQVVGIGRCPYGYQFVREYDPVRERRRVVGLDPDPTTAPIAQRIWRDSARLSLDAISAQLNTEGVPSPGGVHWSTTALRKILRNPVYVGTAAYGRCDKDGRERDRALWLLVPVPALVTPDDAAATEAAIAARRRRPRGRNRQTTETGDPFILRGRLTCGHCHDTGKTEGAMAVRPHENGPGAYQCLRALPSRARKTLKALCHLPRLPARALQPLVWDAVTAALLNPDTLETGLRAGQAQYRTAQAQWATARRTLDRQLAHHRKVLTELVVSQATARRGGPTWQALAQAIQQADTTITQLERERDDGAPRVLPGISPDQATALSAFATTVRQGIPATTPNERQEILRLLGWQATVYDDPQGVPCGRHTVRIEWTSRVPLPGARLCIRGTASSSGTISNGAAPGPAVAPLAEGGGGERSLLGVLPPHTARRPA
jgi:site-specific DNA recombinase